MRFIVVCPSLTILLGICLLPAGCSRSPAHAPAAAGEKPKAESDLHRTTLSASQYQSLKVRSAPARITPVQQYHRLHGWVMARPGFEVTLTAPVAGYVRWPEEQAGFSTPGRPVCLGQELLRIDPVLSPVEQASLFSTQVQLATLKRGLEGDLAKAKEALAVAESEQRRVQELYSKGLRGQQDAEKAQAQVQYAAADLAAAMDKLKLFTTSTRSLTEEQTRPVSIVAPRGGTVLQLLVSPGQYVPTASPLVTLADLAEPWLRVPVAEQDLLHLARDRPARIVIEQQGAAPLVLEAAPVALVPQVDPARHTADMVYDLAAALKGCKPLEGKTLARDQMLTVQVPCDTSRPETVVPLGAIVFDAHGGAWIYLEQMEKSGLHHFERRAVELGPLVEEGQVIRPGCKEGEKVVVAGAAALYSREFHKPPAGPPLQVDDDDS